MKPKICDEFGRTFTTLRVSLLSSCNLGCTYCTMSADEVKTGNTENKRKALSPHHILSLIRQLHEELQFTTIRLTGGEPLLYPHLTQVIQGIQEIGIPKIKLTTNGFLLERQAARLKQAGLHSINVSVDALEEEVFFLMSRRSGLHRILYGMEAAQEAGLEVKMNTVLMKNINQNQILPLLDYAFRRNMVIRFLEVMNMGHLYHQTQKYLVTRDEILQVIAAKYDFVPVAREQSATASYWITDAGRKFGIIANESAPFCHDCNRLRLDSQGNIYGCLSNNHPIDIKNCTNTILRQKLMEALRQKQKVKFTGSPLSMLHIGG